MNIALTKRTATPLGRNQRWGSHPQRLQWMPSLLLPDASQTRRHTRFLPRAPLLCPETTKAAIGLMRCTARDQRPMDFTIAHMRIIRIVSISQQNSNAITSTRLHPFPSGRFTYQTDPLCDRSKFIDSHIKPFRCKVDACAKQEFSSTACLLRHEREAHGMHGHGDRPHLCLYPGCERGISGNGFPRRYNLFDHMKRVHDHKDGPTSFTGSPLLDGKLHTRRVGRKRKAPESPDLDPDAQRRKTISGHEQQQTHCPFPLYTGFVPVSAPQYTSIAEDQRRRQRFHQRPQFFPQWNIQRDVIARQAGFVQSPDEEASLQQLSQDVEELRRFSQEGRTG